MYYRAIPTCSQICTFEVMKYSKKEVTAAEAYILVTVCDINFKWDDM